jgi:hypothetical protein
MSYIDVHYVTESVRCLFFVSLLSHNMQKIFINRREDSTHMIKANKVCAYSIQYCILTAKLYFVVQNSYRKVGGRKSVASMEHEIQ